MSHDAISCDCCSSGRQITMTKRRRPTTARIRRSVASISPLALLVLLQPTPSNVARGFLPQHHQRHQHQHRRQLTRRPFRQDGDVDTLSSADGASVVSLVTHTFPPTDLPFTQTQTLPATCSVVLDKMPTWLSQPRGHLAGTNVATLRTAMTSTYLTEDEASLVVSAITEAAAGDDNKVAGAAEFCHILVDTMEMGVSALVAAAFHYCTCVTARERSALLSSSGLADDDGAAFSASSFWDAHGEGMSSSSSNGAASGGIDSYGVHAVLIARDAARIKKTESVAGSVVRKQSGSGSGTTEDSMTNFQNLLLSETKDWRALAIRSAACLYRLRGLLGARAESKDPLTSEEVRETRDALHIYAPLASRLGMHRLKNELEAAAFRIKYRRQYERVMSLALERRTLQDTTQPSFSGETIPPSVTVGEGMARVLREVAQQVKHVLDTDTIFGSYSENVVVSARVKEPYSLWKKILKLRAGKILDIPDALALRVVLNAKKLSPDEPDSVTAARERAMCYYVQKLCVNRWAAQLEEGGRFKDYIGKPKRNGYQSLHYTARTQWGGEDWPLEIQVRSGEMHRVAEYGLAAHWDYKQHKNGFGESNNHNQGHDGSSPSSGRSRRNDEPYLKSVQEWHWQQQQRQQAQAVEAVAATDDVSDAAAGDDQQDYDDRAKRVRARAESIAPYLEAFSAAQSDLAREHVFVFLESEGSSGSGNIVALPSGACVLDALREGARRFDMDTQCWQGKAHHGVEHNGSAAASVTQKLSNGDVVTVPVCNGNRNMSAMMSP